MTRRTKRPRYDVNGHDDKQNDDDDDDDYCPSDGDDDDLNTTTNNNNNGHHDNDDEEINRLAALEEQDYKNLLEIAKDATVVEFDRYGNVLCHTSYLPSNTYDAITGIKKMTLSPSLYTKLVSIHEHVKTTIVQSKNRFVPWAGVGQDTTRLRGFGMVGQNSLQRLNQSSIQLHAPEKMGQDAIDDEIANRKAIMVLEDDWERKGKETAQELIQTILVGDPSSSTATTTTSSSQQDSINSLSQNLKMEDLIAYQPNLHNGAKHLMAHLDWPLHEGFGKVIVTVAIRGGATILLIGNSNNGNDDDDADNDNDSNNSQEQPAWRFHLNEGECYVLSGHARCRCLHAVLADDDSTNTGTTGRMRESLNLRFGLHTKKEAELEITQYWPDEL